jgi:hypothetical protein
MREDLLKVKNKVKILINHINASYHDKEIRDLDYSSLDEAISIVEEFVSKVDLKQYRFSYSFILAFPSLVIAPEIHLLITKKKVIHRLGSISKYSPVKYNALLLNFHVLGLTFDKKILATSTLKEIAERKKMKFSNSLILDNRKRYYPIYIVEIPLKAETLEYII